jgi:hypothetical protein
MSSSENDILGLRDEVARLRVAIDRLGSDVRAVVRTQERTPGRRLSVREGTTEKNKEEARQAAVEALANALAVESGAPDAQVHFGLPGGVVAFHGSTGLLSPRGPVATLLFAGLTILQRQSAPVAPVVTASAPPAWSPESTDVDLSAANVTANSQLAVLNNTTAIESAADAVLNASAWATTETDEDTKHKVETMSVEELQKIMDDATAQAVDQSPTSGVSQQEAAPSAPSSAPEPDAGASRGWGSIAGGALSYIQNNPLAQTVVLEIAKRVKKSLGARTTTPEPADEPAAEAAAEPTAEPAPRQVDAQEPPTPQPVDDDDGTDVFLDASENPGVEDTTTRAEQLLQQAATAPPESPPGSPSAVGGEEEPEAQQGDPKRTLRAVSLLRVASTITDDEAGSPKPSASSASFSAASSPSSTPSSAASSAYPLPFRPNLSPTSTTSSAASSAYSLSFQQSLAEAAHEHADAACGDTPGERAEVVNEVIQLVQGEKLTVDANDARTRLEGALNEACEARARGILEDAILDAQSLRERVKQLASSFNHT